MVLPMEKTILVIAEHARGELKPITWEIIHFAHQIQTFNKAPIRAIILGEKVEDLGKEMVQKTGLDVAAIHIPGLALFNGEAYATILQEVISPEQPVMIIAGHTSQGWDFAPRLAVRLNTSCITGVTGLRFHQDRICFQRPVHGGKVMAETISLTDRTIVTVQPGVFRESETTLPGKGSLQMLTRTLPISGSEVIGIRPAAEEDAGVTEAEVIVAAGRGIGKQENLTFIHRLAALFPKSAVGGSRPLCDLGWLRHAQQIGVTGATVSPRLYLACGISGAYQHLAGMRDSGFIVAINRDPRAAIFNWADVCIVEDLETFIPLLIEVWEKKRSAL